MSKLFAMCCFLCSMLTLAAPFCLSSAAQARQLLTTGNNPFETEQAASTAPSGTTASSRSTATATTAATTAARQNKTAAAVGEKLRINHANADEIAAKMVGIGAKKAQAIIDYRQTHGAFKSMADLDAVKGVGPATLQKNQDRIIFD